MRKASKIENRRRRHHHIRKKISGTSSRPRMAIFKSLKHLYVQLINDNTQSTLLSVSTLDKDSRKQGFKKNQHSAKQLGEKLAARAKIMGISALVLDRAGFKYHGCIKVIADTVRKQGLQF